MATIMACSAFAAICGSNTATAATMGTICLIYILGGAIMDALALLLILFPALVTFLPGLLG